MDLMKKQNSYGTWKKIVPLGELNLVLPGKNQMSWPLDHAAIGIELIKLHISSSYILAPCIMSIRVVEFSNGGYKIRKVFAWESTSSKEIIEFWQLD